MSVGRRNDLVINLGFCFPPQDITLIGFIDRLIAKRPLKFVGDIDSYILRDTRQTGAGNWESIGADSEAAPLIIHDYMTYDEIKLASFLWYEINGRL